MTSLYIGDTEVAPFWLPDEVLTRTMAILAKKGAGKTYTAGVIEEEFAKNHLPFVVLDPVGVHYGIRSTEDGKHESPYPVVVFGGLHGDIPIDEHMGQAIAEAVIDENISCIVDLSEFSKGAWRRFTRDFCLTLYRKNTTPRHVFVEEATEFVPQTRRPEMQEAYEAVERMIRLGRNRGLGVTIIAQRSAQVAKDVLTQLDVLIVQRTVGTQDRKAILDILQDVIEEDELPMVEQMKKTMPSLPNGAAWVWSPEFLKCFGRIQIRERETFHGGATPTFAKTKLVQARPDVTKLRERLAPKPAEDPEPVGSKTPDHKNCVSAGDLRVEQAALSAEQEAHRETLTEKNTLEQHNKRLVEEVKANKIEAENYRTIRRLLNVDGVGPIDYVIDEEAIIQKVIARVGTGGGQVVQVTPPEAFRKKYLTEAVDRAYEKISGITDKQRRLMELLLSKPVFWGVNAINKALGKGLGGSQAQDTRTLMNDLIGIGIVIKGGINKAEYKAHVDGYVRLMLDVHSPTDQEVSDVVQHVLARLVS